MTHREPFMLHLKNCSYGGGAFRFVGYDHDGWQNTGNYGPGTLEMEDGTDVLGNTKWKIMDDAGYMASVVALKELLMQTVRKMQTTGTFPALSWNTAIRKPKGKGKSGKRGQHV